MNFQQPPMMQQNNPFGGPAPASPQQNNPFGEQPQQQQPPQSAADPFAAFGAAPAVQSPPAQAPMPVPMSPQQGMMQTSPMAMAASPVSVASSGSAGSSNSAGTAPSLGATAADPFASFGVPQVSPQPQAHQPQVQAQESPTALMQGQPPAMGLRQPSLGTAEMQQSPAPAPVQAPAPALADPFRMAGAPQQPQLQPQVQAQPPAAAPVAALVQATAQAPAPAEDPWNINSYGPPPAEAPVAAPPAPPMEAPPTPPVQQEQVGALVVQPAAAAQQGQQQQAYANYNLGTGYAPAPNPVPEQQAQAPASPFGAAQHVVPASPVQQQQMVASPVQTPAACDLFGVFNQQQPSPPQPQPLQLAQQSPVPGAAPTSPVAQANEDFWGDFAAPSPTPAAGAAPAQQQKPAGPLTFDENGLPAGGVYYNCRIHVAKLGVLFFKATDLTKSLFMDANPEAVNAIGKRATVGHVFDGSAAESSGIGLGHVLLKVNGTEVQSADEAAHLIKTAPRPLHLECYAPPKEHCGAVVFASKHMVKYDDKGKYAPQSMWEWKPKYVVIGGVISDPLQMNMYYSKADYDTAVMEVQSGQTQVSVKVKQFGLHNAALVSDQNGQTRTIEYRETWHYLCIVPEHGNPIKIAATKHERLEKIKAGIVNAQELYRLQDIADRKEAQEYAASMQASAPAPSYDAYCCGGTDFYSQQQQQPYQQQTYQQPAPQELSYGQGYAQPVPPPQQQQQQQQLQYSGTSSPWASY